MLNCKMRKKIERKIKSTETQSVNVVSHEFPTNLQNALNSKIAHVPKGIGGGYVSQVLTIECQADSLICCMCLSKCCQLIE